MKQVNNSGENRYVKFFFEKLLGHYSQYYGVFNPKDKNAIDDLHDLLVVKCREFLNVCDFSIGGILQKELLKSQRDKDAWGYVFKSNTEEPITEFLIENIEIKLVNPITLGSNYNKYISNSGQLQEPFKTNIAWYVGVFSWQDVPKKYREEIKKKLQPDVNTMRIQEIGEHTSSEVNEALDGRMIKDNQRKFSPNTIERACKELNLEYKTVIEVISKIDTDEEE